MRCSVAKRCIVDYLEIAMSNLDQETKEDIKRVLKRKGEKKPRPFSTWNGFQWTRKLVVESVRKRYKLKQARKLLRKTEIEFISGVNSCIEAAKMMCDMAGEGGREVGKCTVHDD